MEGLLLMIFSDLLILGGCICLLRGVLSKNKEKEFVNVFFGFVLIAIGLLIVNKVFEEKTSSPCLQKTTSIVLTCPKKQVFSF